ncbi:substrate-binding domain-containing protein [Streptomyces sp. RGM 3693]|uniref:substrate-binding domain-containing protein n=1 Tax=Streptomyces sp. RGM 3693 TaxID=3413284 RepID=UPI003D2E4C37
MPSPLAAEACLAQPAAEGRSEAEAVKALLAHRCEALILLGPDAEPTYLDALGQRTVPASVGHRVPQARVDCPQGAEGKGMRQAMDHLVELGHRRIVHIEGGQGPGASERRRSHRAAMRRYGLEAELRVIPGTHTEHSGIETGRLLLAGRDRGPPPPTAVLAGNNRCARGLLTALARGGIEVPRDRYIIGYDDSRLSPLMPIGLTTVRQDALASCAVDHPADPDSSHALATAATRRTEWLHVYRDTWGFVSLILAQTPDHA